MSKEVIEKLIMENNRAINGLTRQAIYFSGTINILQLLWKLDSYKKNKND